MIKGDRRRNDNNAWVFTLRRVQTEVANSACDQEPDVAVAQMILANGFEYRLRHIPHRHRNFETDRVRRIPKSREMFLEPKDTPVVKANALENSIAVKQTMI